MFVAGHGRHCSTRCSHGSGGPGDWVLSLWVESGWVTELSIVVLFVELGLNLLGDLDEVGHMEAVAKVLVKVILEVLEEVHSLLNEIVSSNSWEGEGGIVELPGVDGHWVVLTGGLQERVVDLVGIVIVDDIKGSGEVVELNIKLISRKLEWLKAWVSELDVGDISWDVALNSDGLAGGDEAEGGEGNEGVFHL